MCIRDRAQAVQRCVEAQASCNVHHVVAKAARRQRVVAIHILELTAHTDECFHLCSADKGTGAQGQRHRLVRGVGIRS